MKILHILLDGQSKLASDIVAEQSKDNEVKVIDLTKKEASYEAIVDEIFASDQVVSW